MNIYGGRVNLVVPKINGMGSGGEPGQGIGIALFRSFGWYLSTLMAKSGNQEEHTCYQSYSDDGATDCNRRGADLVGDDTEDHHAQRHQAHYQRKQTHDSSSHLGISQDKGNRSLKRTVD